MKKPIVLSCVDGLTGEVLTTIDVSLVGLKAMNAIIEYQLEKCVFGNEHDLQIRFGYRP